MKYDYLVLDFNGTIIDDVDLCLNILNHLLEERNYKKVSLEEYKHIFTFLKALSFKSTHLFHVTFSIFSSFLW